MVVFDASPLVVLASADRLAMLEGIDRPLVVPERVRREVVDAGIDAGHADARRLKGAIDRDLLSVDTVERTTLFDELLDLDGLSEPDAAVLAHAADDDGVAVMDEQYGRSVASAEGVRTRGTAYIVLSRVSAGALPPTEGRGAIDDLVDAGWYCSTDLYRTILSTLEEL